MKYSHYRGKLTVKRAVSVENLRKRFVYGKFLPQKIRWKSLYFTQCNRLNDNVQFHDTNIQLSRVVVFIHLYMTKYSKDSWNALKMCG